MTAGALPPGPKGHFLVGNLPEFGKDVLGFFSDCAQQYGDVVSLKLGAWPAVFINHPDHFDYVLLANNKSFIKHRFFWRHVTDIFGSGLVTNEGSPWLRQRRLMQPAFHRERVAAYGQTMVDYTEKMLDGWDSANSASRDIHNDMMALSMAIATKTLLGTEVSPAATKRVGAAFDDAVVSIANRFRRPVKIPQWIPLPSNLRYARAVGRLNRLIYGFIEEKQKSPGEDLLSMLLEVRDEDGSSMDLKQVRDEAITMFLAGHETTAITLSWTFYLLAQHPEIEERLVREIAQTGMSDLPRLPLLTNVINESMRLYPPAYAFGREAIEDCEIGGYPVPKGTTVFMSPWVSHRDARWFKDPLTFNPDRWENDFAKKLPRFAYLPFGGGPRVCIGNSFALMESALVLASVLQRYRLNLTNGANVQPFASITLRPQGGMPMSVAPRN